MNDAIDAELGAGPLAGVRVLDLTSIVLGPLATVTLAGLGADIIKVEAPEGDNVREAGVMRNEGEGMGHVFMHNNRGKRSLVLDLKQAAARAALLKLAQDADVLLSNIRPAAMKRLGLDYAALSAVNPRLIYVNACGFSARGPYADRPAYDDLIQGATAIPWLMQQYGTEQPAYAPVSLADRVTGLHVVYAITAALYARERSGRGQEVEVAMFESVAHFVLADHMAGRSFEPEVSEAGYDRLLSHDRRPYRTADGYLCVLIYNDKHWRNFFQSVGRPELFADPRFCTQRARSRNIRYVYAWVASVMPERTTAEWQTLLDQADIPHQKINSIDDLLEDPHLVATGFIAEEEHPSQGLVRTLGNPTSWSGTPLGTMRPAPALGEHSAQILSEAGYTAAQIAAMADSGATALGSNPPVSHTTTNPRSTHV
ncbi:CaiB/BaiF CoA transferase family protein [Undibacterium sp. TJN25]|uniref:CaiB/BaiF CoA transferase family protein n=1 Tax=Undibacterium sp. TJN25 TaxID=3413056 RepID=UPI003BF440BC